MRSHNKIIVVAILTLAFFVLINVNDATRAASPNPPTRVAPADGAVFLASDTITLESSPFFDPDDDDGHFQTHWEVWRYDTEMPLNDVYPFVSYDELESHVLVGQLQEGLKYGWRVGYEDYYNNVTYSDDFFFKIGTSEPENLETIQAGTSLGDFGMVSIVHWPDNPDPEVVFGITYDPNNYRIGIWDPEQNKYIEADKGLIIEPGRAYWILTRDPLKVHFTGVPVSMTEDIDVCLHTQEPTGTGWNMIAPPNKANYYWNQVKVGCDDPDYMVDPPVLVTNPVASDLIIHRIWEWKDGKYIEHKLDDNFVLEYYKGYWVKAIREDVYLMFDYDAQVPLEGRFTTWDTMLAWKGKAVRWMKSLLPAPREAIADNDSPPMPMGLFEDSVDPVFEGCFVESVVGGP